MAKVLILGGGFAGVVAAERLASQLSNEHQITVVSRSRQFVFYPALVKLAFKKCEPADVSFQLRNALLSRKVNFIEAEVAHMDPIERRVTIAHGEVEGKLSYDYLIFALGRRLATERVTGFYEHAHHLLSVDKAIKFGDALATFHKGRAVLGHCPGARLPIPVYETAFALAQRLEEDGHRNRVRITVVSPEALETEVGDEGGAAALRQMFDAHQIELVEYFPIHKLTAGSLQTELGDALTGDLLMLVPPFRGPAAASYLRTINAEGYIDVDMHMRVIGHERVYAAGDCVNFAGLKMGHMAVRQAEVAAANLAAEIDGHESIAQYSHEMRFVIENAGESLYLHKDMWKDEPGTVRHGRFWSWAKLAHERFWQLSHA